MTGCLPLSVKRFLNPHAPRPYLPVDEPVAVQASVRGPQPTSAGLAGRRRSIEASRASSDAGSRQRDGRRLVRSNEASTKPQANNGQRNQRNAAGNRKNSTSRTRGESRPTGLFAGMGRGPTPAPDSTPYQRNGTAIEQRTPRMVPASDLAGMGMERTRHHPSKPEFPSTKPSWAPPTGWIVTAARGQAARGQPTRPGPSHPYIRPSRETLQTPIPIAFQDGSSIPRDADATLNASIAELPGSFAEVTEKEAVAVSPSVRTMASFDTLDTTVMHSGSPRPPQLDSVIELPGCIPKTQTQPAVIELPGSSPVIMEKDAGPLPPTELPASMPERMAVAVE